MPDYLARAKAKMSGNTQYLKGKFETMSGHKRILPWLAILSFLESIIIPVPLEAILVPLMLKDRERFWQFALSATIGCIAGAMVGYGVGIYFLETFSHELSELFGTTEQLQNVMQQIRRDGFIYILFIGVTPVPFQVAMLAAGAVQYPFVLFILATLIARSLRYFGLGVLIYFLGPVAMDLVRRYRFPATTILTITFLLVIFNMTGQ